jgi:sulfatase modifying factor 1
MLRTSCSVALIGLVGAAQARDEVSIGPFRIDRTEVTVGAFERFVSETGRVTAAERDGGGFEYVQGWTRRPGWTFRRPSGEAASPHDPVSHVTWEEARNYCASAGGRLPTLEEWRRAAFTEERSTPADGFERGRTYPYAVGTDPAGMNTSDRDPWPRQAQAGQTKPGVNGLFDMGGNVWEWLADRRGDEALTAGGSWWYGPDQTRAEAPQWKQANFYAVYIGFRCAYG